MPMPWLKLWHTFLDSPKVQRVTEALRARYVNLLCVACKFDQNGRLPDVAEIAFLMRLDPKDTAKTLAALVDAKLIDRRASVYYVHDWDQWQSGKSKAAEKQQRYRDRRNALRNALRNDEVTNGSHVTSSRAREELELEKDKDKEEIQPGTDHGSASRRPPTPSPSNPPPAPADARRNGTHQSPGMSTQRAIDEYRAGKGRRRRQGGAPP